MRSNMSRRRFLSTCGAGASALAISPVLGIPFDPDPTLFAMQAAGSPLAALLDDLVAANRILAREQVLDAFGHVSVRHPTAADRFFLARSIAPALVTAADLMEHNLDGAPVDPRGRTPYRERFIHSEIYRARTEVRAIVHCHAFIAEGVPVFEIRDAAGMTDMLVSDANIGRALAHTLGTKPAVLMRGHGAAIVGDSLPTVVGRSVYLEVNARVQAQAMAIGNGKITYLTPEEARKYLAPSNYDRAWDLWKKEVSR